MNIINDFFNNKNLVLGSVFLGLVYFAFKILKGMTAELSKVNESRSNKVDDHLKFKNTKEKEISYKIFDLIKDSIVRKDFIIEEKSIVSFAKVFKQSSDSGNPNIPYKVLKSCPKYYGSFSTVFYCDIVSILVSYKNGEVEILMNNKSSEEVKDLSEYQTPELIDLIVESLKGEPPFRGATPTVYTKDESEEILKLLTIKG